MSLIMTLYNHKGGVSKTTTTYHLANAIAEFTQKKVLLVDADPQCNLTELCLTQQLEGLDARESATESLGLPGTSLKEALWPRLEGERPDVDVNAIELIPLEQNRLYLFRGDIGLSEAEDRLSYAHSQRLTVDLHQKRNYIAVHDMLRRLIALHSFDYVLVDVGPSAGALTRSFFLSADRFLVPVSPDRFNLQAIGSLSRILTTWIREHAGVVGDFKKLGLNVAKGEPQFRGLIVQRFQRHKSQAKPSYRIWMEKIPARAQSELLPSLVAAAADKSIVPSRFFENPTAVEIPDFGSLAPMMANFGKPVWRLTKQETGWQGNVWDDRSREMAKISDLFKVLLEGVIE